MVNSESYSCTPSSYDCLPYKREKKNQIKKKYPAVPKIYPTLYAAGQANLVLVVYVSVTAGMTPTNLQLFGSLQGGSANIDVGLLIIGK